ncbi:uncharacterized protein K452DRAFT_279216 [Aplosporella prunicola CBS 121167]|uniref:Jacalin-type lectin domain-containing protein n=1 Tax=Aplosporella prunicola CBS 121167 TaxID=1176127 RepID=A0A6A6AYN3_9PEZI|nr:uncharacterized protein K452DRAFT_279216 [Aplosporella prunicola CBS 121167]KAF2137039.1 hypothetical protein K452DRAFT_279216 [Aplosporella prunicola CBS 121167]
MVFSHLALLASAAPFALAATSGSFNALSFNVAGLPQFLQGNDESGDKTSNTAEVGKRFAQYGYDIIHVQEDFNYHATLYEYDNHTYRTPTSGGVPFGSGLNTLSNFDWIDFTRTKWDKCSDASEFNCFTPKGFTFMRLKIDDGVYIDCYNLHTDAGTEEGNQVARRANVQQVADYIDTYSVGNAVLVFGDTNSRYTRTEDNINLFHTQNNLTDAWLSLERNNEIPTVEEVCGNPAENSTCEVVDKMFYRGSPVLTLNAKSFAYDSQQFLSANGTTLSDHNPMLVEFEWSSSETLRQSNFIGGPHGAWFSDSANLTAKASPKGAKLILQGQNRLDAVAITLGDGTALAHGGTGGDASDLQLAADEYVNMVYACQDKYNDHTRVFYLEARTNKEGRVTAGVATNDCATFNAPEGWGLVGFVGQDGDEIDQLAVLWAPA